MPPSSAHVSRRSRLQTRHRLRRRYRRRHRAGRPRLAIGKPATGTIVHLIDTGTTINDDTVVEFVVRVIPLEGDAFEAHAKALVSRLDVPSFQPGRVVPVKYDPEAPTRIALDLWECPKK